MNDARVPQPAAGSDADAPDPQGSERARTRASNLEHDPIFQAAEPKERASRSTILVWQFFLFPLLVVAAAVGVFVFFGAIAGGQRNPKELLAELRSGSENQQKQAAQQLAGMIADERNRVDRELAQGKTDGAAPFYADPEFQEGILAAFRTAMAEPDSSEERRQWLALALGRIAPRTPSAEGRAIASELVQVLYPEPPNRQQSSAVRLHAAHGLKDMESRDAEEGLVRAAADPDDPGVRIAAVNGLALLGLAKHGGGTESDPRTIAVLRERLGDGHVLVQLNAAVALGLRGDATGRSLLLRSLDDGELRVLGIDDAGARQSQKANAIQAAAALGDAELRAAVQRLTTPDHEGDPATRRLAQQALERWRSGTG